MKVNSDVRIWYCSFKWLVWAWCLQWWLLQQKGSVFGVFPTGQYFKTFYFQESSLLLLLKQFFFFFFFGSEVTFLFLRHYTQHYLIFFSCYMIKMWASGEYRDPWRTYGGQHITFYQAGNPRGKNREVVGMGSKTPLASVGFGNEGLM